MLSFKSFLKEQSASIEMVLGKINDAKTEDGLKELEKYYKKRQKEVEVGESDDITVRDAIEGRRAEIKAEIEAAKGEDAKEEV